MSRPRALALAVLRHLAPIAVALVAIQLLDDTFLVFVTYVVAWSAAGLGAMAIARRGRPTQKDLAWALYPFAAFLVLVLVVRGL